jgi:hypothetical protein
MSSHRFLCITSAELAETNSALQAACFARDVAWHAIDPDDGALANELELLPGDLLYAACTRVAANLIERHLWSPSVGSFIVDPARAWAPPALQLARAGVATPRGFCPLPRGAEKLARLVAQLGGYPVVLKTPGGEGGRGVLRADSASALFALADYVPQSSTLCEYVEHALAYRLVVVGARVVSSEAWHAAPFDFRTNAGGTPLGPVEPPAQAVELALSASRALGVRFGGADVLHAADGRLLLTELNCPCFFADQQRRSGHDIAGAMLDELIARSRAARG